MSSRHVTLMGAFEVRVDGSARGPWPHRRAAELVKLLAIADHHNLHREQVMDVLWPHLDPDAAAANLRKAVHHARRALGSDASLVTSGELIRLWPGAEVDVDLVAFETAARAALRSRDPEALGAAAELWTGEPLAEDRYAPWADDTRERLRLLALDLFRAAELWTRALDVDPIDEQAHRALMEKALDTGDRRGAIRQFERLRARLKADLGMGPDSDSVALYEKALALEGAQPPTAAERCRALLSWALVHLNSGELDAAESKAREARSLAIDAELGAEIGETSAVIGIVANMRGRWKELFLEEFIGWTQRSPRAASYIFDAHLCLAEFFVAGPSAEDEIVSYAQRLLETAEETRSVQGRALAELLLGEVAYCSDRLEAAEKHLRTSISLHDEAAADSGRALALHHLAEVAVARGRRSEADALLDRGLKLSKADPLAAHLLVRMYGGLVEAAADAETAARRVETADAVLQRSTVCPPCSMGFRVAATGALARIGHLDRAQFRLEEAERLAGMWPAGPWHAALWEARGVLRDAQGHPGQAAVFFSEAAERFAAFGRPRDAARCRSAAGIRLA